ncbi:MAG: hypothetical protein IPJ26_16265 [Bacteroidetes bacterium]|nr:hypothetical protein [Bacteroidota bacterium]
MTIDGIDLTESIANTTATTVMEFGYALFKASGTDGVKIIRYKIVRLH